MYTDPVTLEALTEPLLASDGYTYNAPTLAEIVTNDAWHRSPITAEVLRPWAYPNALISAHLGCATPPPTRLYDGALQPCIMPPDGRLLCLGLPGELSCAEEIARHGLRLPAERMLLLAKARRDGPTGQDVLMHAPCPDSMRADLSALSTLFGLQKLVHNWWCLSDAVLQWADGSGSTVEAWWQERA
jgi:hypothetical protein